MTGSLLARSMMSSAAAFAEAELIAEVGIYIAGLGATMQTLAGIGGRPPSAFYEWVVFIGAVIAGVGGAAFCVLWAASVFRSIMRGTRK